MKTQTGGLIVAAALALTGCGVSAAQHAENLVIAGGHQSALELCIDAATKAHAAGVPNEKVNADYNACADAADKQSELGQ